MSVLIGLSLLHPPSMALTLLFTAVLMSKKEILCFINDDSNQGVANFLNL